jgi:hypothetical protein
MAERVVRASRKVVVAPGALVRQNAHHHYKDMAGQHTPAGARTVLLEHHGMDCPGTQTTTSKRGAAAAPPPPLLPRLPPPRGKVRALP